jgi:MFS family permease
MSDHRTAPALTREHPAPRGSAARRLVFGLVSLQVVAGVLGAFYTPLLTPIARNVGMRDADWNWFDSALAAVAALALPLLTKLGDVIGHRRVLVFSTVVVAASSWLAVVATDFWTLFAAFALQGFIAVWLPFELALVRDATPPEQAENRIAKVSSFLTVVFLIGSVFATAFGGQLFTINGGWDALQTGLDAGLAPGDIVGFRESLVAILLIPAVISTLAIPAVMFLIPRSTGRTTTDDGIGDLGLSGLLVLGGIMVAVVVGFGLVKLGGTALVLGWIVVAVSAIAIVPYLRWQSGVAAPAVDIAVLRDRRRGPYLIAAIFLTIVYSTVTVPTVTFFTTDRESVGYGIGATPADISVIMLAMIGTIIVVASVTTRVNSAATRQWLLRLAPLMFVVQYSWLFVFHDSLWHAVVTAILGGIGAGVLIPGLPAVIATTAPEGRVAADIGVFNIFSIAGATAGSAIFALALHDTAESSVTAAPLSGYMTVWAITIALALVLAVILWFARPPLAAAAEKENTNVR